MGATFQFQMCNLEECEDIYSDIREKQCQEWDHSDKQNWLPYEHKECKYSQFSNVSKQMKETKINFIKKKNVLVFLNKIRKITIKRAA